MSTRHTPSLGVHLETLAKDIHTLSEEDLQRFDFTQRIALAMENSTTTDHDEECKREAANLTLFEYLHSKTSLTMTAESMQRWDGDCWFNAVAYQLNQLQLSSSRRYNADKLRKSVHTYLTDHKKELMIFFTVDSDYEPTGLTKDEQYDKECAFMKRKSNWNSKSSMSEIALQSLAIITKSIFKVHQADQNVWTIGTEPAEHVFHFGRVNTPQSAHIHALIPKAICKSYHSLLSDSIHMISDY